MRTRLLYEMFIPEARFPDEKFWNKDGSPIHPEPKGPPPGTRGKTHADFGAHDKDDHDPFDYEGRMQYLPIPQDQGWESADVYDLVDRLAQNGIKHEFDDSRGDIWVDPDRYRDAEKIVDDMSQG